MDKDKALAIITKLKEFAEAHHMGLIIVGSVAYRNALKHPENFSLCDDLDCIFVYETITDVQSSFFADQLLIDTATRLLGQETRYN